MKWTLAALFIASLVVPATALAGHGPTHENFPGLPGAAMWGICNAYAHNEKGRENGNAGNAPPFAWLADQAEAEDQTVEEYCAQFAKPGNGQGNPNNTRRGGPPAGGE